MPLLGMDARRYRWPPVGHVTSRSADRNAKECPRSGVLALRFWLAFPRVYGEMPLPDSLQAQAAGIRKTSRGH